MITGDSDRAGKTAIAPTHRAKTRHDGHACSGELVGTEDRSTLPVAPVHRILERSHAIRLVQRLGTADDDLAVTAVQIRALQNLTVIGEMSSDV